MMLVSTKSGTKNRNHHPQPSTPHEMALLQLYKTIHGNFLVPPNYPGHDHVWVSLDAGLNICKICGTEHICFQGACKMIQMEHSESICAISGCVIILSELRSEWSTAADSQQHHEDEPLPPSTMTMTKKHSISDVYDTVEMVVREILDSSKTARCMQEETLRDDARRSAYLARIIRDIAIDQEALNHRPNILDLEAKLAWQCRKFRRLLSKVFCFSFRFFKFQMFESLTRKEQAKRDNIIHRVIRLCVDNICNLIQKYGWHRVTRQMQHSSRGREFICSMLYLMRMGITFRNQIILQKVDILNQLLPLQIFLPSVFQIRPKSITEGENIIKLDIQRMQI